MFHYPDMHSYSLKFLKCFQRGKKKTCLSALKSESLFYTKVGSYRLIITIALRMKMQVCQGDGMPTAQGKSEVKRQKN